jgi:hypothetical protein
MATKTNHNKLQLDWQTLSNYSCSEMKILYNEDWKTAAEVEPTEFAHVFFAF